MLSRRCVSVVLSEELKMQRFRLLASTLSLLALLGVVGPALAEPTDNEQIDNYIGQSAGAQLAQVNSVSELTDVDPNSWAFQALKSVVERFGVIEGYPDKTFRGNKPLTRYEFAAGLNAALEKVNELITAGNADRVTKEDLATLQRLQDEFRTELAALRGRVDALEARTKDIESKLFNTNSKLDASVVMAVTGGGADVSRGIFSGTAFGASPPFGDALGATFIPGGIANTTFVSRTSLNIRATFSGEDELLVRLRGVSGQDMGAAFPGIASGLGTLFYAGSSFGTAYDQSTPNVSTNGISTVQFDKIRYTSNLFSDKFRIFFGPRIDIFEFIDTNSFANNEEVDFSSGFLINNPLTTFIFTGAGGGLDFQLNDFIGIRGIYIAANPGAAVGNPLVNSNAFGVPFGAFGAGGIVGGQSIVSGELEINPLKTASIKFTYSNFTEQGGVLGFLVPGNITNAVTNAYGVNAEWAIFPGFAIFGRYGLGTSNVNVVAGTASYAPISTTTWQAGLALPDFLIPGSTLAAAYGQPIRTNVGSAVVPGGATVSLVPSGTEGNIEVFYRIQVSDRLSITPDVQFILQPVNSVNSNGLTIGTLRAVFTF
ncbi:MAG: carbohydrate porin [Gemmatimonadaceae bacterium]|nr:carbohydrate porin [Gloeobacterales cyanobacterium ES-bin-141]